MGDAASMMSLFAATQIAKRVNVNGGDAEFVTSQGQQNNMQQIKHSLDAK